MSTQLTHHGYAVNVNDYGYPPNDPGPLTDDDVQVIWEAAAEGFWADAQGIARAYGFEGVYAEGRSAGWAKPHPQPATDDMWAHAVDEWVAETFRPFECAILECMDYWRDDFLSELAYAVECATREPSEAAYWAARDVVTVDS
jgi:hypothetical protein